MRVPVKVAVNLWVPLLRIVTAQLPRPLVTVAVQAGVPLTEMVAVPSASARAVRATDEDRVLVLVAPLVMSTVTGTCWPMTNWVTGVVTVTAVSPAGGAA